MGLLYTTNEYTKLKVLMNDEENPLGFTHTPFKVNPTNDEEAITLVLGDAPNELTLLGSYDEVFNDDTKHNIYKRIYPYDVAITYVDEDNNSVEYHLPKKIGEFASWVKL